MSRTAGEQRSDETRAVRGREKTRAVRGRESLECKVRARVPVNQINRCSLRYCADPPACWLPDPTTHRTACQLRDIPKVSSNSGGGANGPPRLCRAVSWTTPRRKGAEQWTMADFGYAAMAGHPGYAANDESEDEDDDLTDAMPPAKTRRSTPACRRRFMGTPA